MLRCPATLPPHAIPGPPPPRPASAQPARAARRPAPGDVALQLHAWVCWVGGAPRADDAAASDLVDLPGPSTARVPLRALCADVYCSPAGERYFQLHLAAPARRGWWCGVWCGVHAGRAHAAGMCTAPPGHASTTVQPAAAAPSYSRWSTRPADQTTSSGFVAA
eukprot:scaffold29329_cov56-Phaeocystis_antarctica.AAC.2